MTTRTRNEWGEKRGKGDLDESERHLVKADFRYNEERGEFHCPGGQLLRLKTVRRTGHRVYQGDFGCVHESGATPVAGEFSLVCVAHNLKKIIFSALRGEVCPEFGKRAAWA